MAESSDYGAQPRVVIVDDDRDMRELLATALEMDGFKVATAANGLRLITTLHLNRPDLIVLDVNMSWIDGFELCRAVRSNRDFAHIPVMFVSGRASQEDRQRGLECGGDDYFVKPVELSQLVHRAKELASHSREQHA
jgi:DNA-binding response OmpR family regulator